jgi:hypothetical protein
MGASINDMAILLHILASLGKNGLFIFFLHICKVEISYKLENLVVAKLKSAINWKI